MNKSDVISKLKAYTPAALTCVGIIGSVMTNLNAQRLSKSVLVAYKRNCNNWRKMHCKPMKRRKQLEKVKSFY